MLHLLPFPYLDKNIAQSVKNDCPFMVLTSLSSLCGIPLLVLMESQTVAFLCSKCLRKENIRDCKKNGYKRERSTHHPGMERQVYGKKWRNRRKEGHSRDNRSPIIRKKP
jgi:hypothetical protein